MPEQKPHLIEAANAARIYDWLKTRGGLAVWGSVNLSDPTKSWTAPLNDDNGVRKTKPRWECTTEPVRIITDPAEVMVSVPKEVDRFRVAVRMGAQGFMLKLTDASGRKLNARKEKAHAKHNTTVFHEFDYNTQEAVIYADTEVVPIEDYIRKNPVDTAAHTTNTAA